MTTSPDFLKPSTLGDRTYFKPADHNGRLVMFIGGRKGDGLNIFGEPYTQCDMICVLDGDVPQTYTMNGAELTNKALQNQAQSGTFVLGVLGQATSKSGKDYWTLTDADEVQTEAARAWFVKHVEQRDGVWQLKANPDEAPF